MVPEYLTPTNGGLLSPGQLMGLSHAVFLKYGGPGVAELVLEITPGVMVGKVSARAMRGLGCCAVQGPDMRALGVLRGRRGGLCDVGDGQLGLCGGPGVAELVLDITPGVMVGKVSAGVDTLKQGMGLCCRVALQIGQFGTSGNLAGWQIWQSGNSRQADQQEWFVGLRSCCCNDVRLGGVQLHT
jgi:hypothetical protein